MTARCISLIKKQHLANDSLLTAIDVNYLEPSCAPGITDLRHSTTPETQSQPSVLWELGLKANLQKSLF